MVSTYDSVDIQFKKFFVLFEKIHQKPLKEPVSPYYIKSPYFELKEHKKYKFSLTLFGESLY